MKIRLKRIDVPVEPTAAMLRASLSPYRGYMPHVAKKMMAHNRKVWIRMVLAHAGIPNNPGV